MRPLWLVAALAGACSSPYERPTGDGDLPYPRIASRRDAALLDDPFRALLTRIPLAIVDAEAGAVDAASLSAVATANPRLQLLALLASEDIHRAPQPATQPLALARVAKIPVEAWALEPGSTTVGMTSDADTRIKVADPAAFSVTRPASARYPADEPTYVMVGGEHMRLIAIEGDELVVERLSAPAMHVSGSPIAAHVAVRTGTWLVDITKSAWRDILVAEAEGLLATGTWDGIALDACATDVATLSGGVLDLDRNGIADDLAMASSAWTAGYGELVASLRGALGAEIALVGTTDGRDCPHDALDGIVFDGVPLGPESPQAGAFEHYVQWTARAGHPPLSIASAYAPGIGSGDVLPGQDELARVDYQAMRFGLAMAAMGDGYYTFDNGPFGHTSAWWYDEYDGAGLGMGWLGHPQGPATRIGGGAYVRTFTKGLVIVNPTSTPTTFSVPAGHRKLDGEQDPTHNDGSEVIAPIIVNGMDAYLLAR
jgi:hypothetical protein